MSVEAPQRISEDSAGPLTRGLAELGYLARLALSAPIAVFWTRRPAPRFATAVARHLDELLRKGLPLVVMIGTSLGAFLTMQAYFSATFREAAGAVVGVGLLRNLASLVTGFLLSGMLAAWIVPELRRGSRVGIDADPRCVPDRDVARGDRADDREAPEPSRIVAVRLASAALAAPMLAVWLATSGLLMGVLVAQSKLAVSPGLFVNKLLSIIELKDLAGLLGKSVLFAVAAALFACREGLREGSSEPSAVSRDAWRAVFRSALAVMLINNVWFSLSYLAGSPYGPTIVVR